MAPTTVDIGTLIVATPGVVGGAPRIAGTRIPVSHIARCLADGLTPQQMVEQYPTITLTGAYAAITYYMANRETIDEDIQSEDAEVEEFLAGREANANPAG